MGNWLSLIYLNPARSSVKNLQRSLYTSTLKMGIGNITRFLNKLAVLLFLSDQYTFTMWYRRANVI